METKENNRPTAETAARRHPEPARNGVWTSPSRSPDIDREIEQRLRKIGKNVKMPGFRPGKVPQKIIAQQYGDQARYEAVRRGPREDLRRSGEERPAARRRSAADQSEGRRGQEPAQVRGGFSRVYPEVKLNELKGVEIERANPRSRSGRTRQHARSAAQAARPLRARRSRRGERRPRDDRLHRQEGRRSLPGADRRPDLPPFVLGQAQMLPDFEKAIVGMKAGESKSFDMTVPGRLLLEGSRRPGSDLRPHRQGSARVDPARSRRRFCQGARRREWRPRQDARRNRSQPEA